MMRLKLPILYYKDSEEVNKLESMGLPAASPEYTVKPHVFYNIDSLAPRDAFTCTIYSSGDVFVCNMPLTKLDELIMQSYKTELLFAFKN